MKTTDFNDQSAGYLASLSKTGPRSPWTGLWADLARCYQTWQTHRQNERALKHVAKFNAHMLNDVGLTIADVANKQPKPHFASTDTVGRPG